MGYEVWLQWAVLFLAFIVLIYVNRRPNTREKRSLQGFFGILMIINASKLFEQMADERSELFMAFEIGFGVYIFVGYYLCRFLCDYTRKYLPKWFEVYLLVYDLIMVMVVWTSQWHVSIFADVKYEISSAGGQIYYEPGEMYIFVVLGSLLLPVAISVIVVLLNIAREEMFRLRIRTAAIAVCMYGMYVMISRYFVRKTSEQPVVMGTVVLLFASAFVYWYCTKDGFSPEKSAAESMFSAITEGVLVVDSSWKLQSYNRAAKRIFPSLEPSALRHNIKKQSEVPLELFEEYDKKTITIADRIYEVRQIPVCNDWKEIQAYVLIFKDFTTERNYQLEISSGKERAQKAEQEAVRALSEAKQADRIKTDFLTNVSHEIRTPMNAIVGLSELIIEESRGRKVYDFACDIKNASSNLLTVINDILSLSKIEAGHMKLEQTEYCTEQLLEEQLHLSKVAASSRGLQLKRSISPKLPCQLIGDPIRIRQMISNFLDFGMKYTSRGHVKISVSHKWLNDEQVLLIFQFEDTGEGFTSEEAEKLFDQFQRMDGRREHNLESIGLGIAITKRFVDLMDGTVEVHSELGKGTTFTVCFPQRVADMKSIEQKPWHKNDVMAEIDRAFIVPDYRVLVVDDNKINLKVASGALEPYQFRIDEAKSGQQAIEMVKNVAYDIIFMDHMMPEMDGIEATDHIRNDCGENGKKPVIIALSANAYNNAREMFVNNGFQDFIAKPLDKSELHKMLCKWIPQDRRKSVEGTKESQEKISRAGMAELFMVGVDTKKALSLHSGGISDYLELLELYYMDGAEKCNLLERLLQEGDFKNYEIEVHGLKSASANIGAMDFSEQAKSHEFAAKEGNEKWIREHADKLFSEYRFLLREVERVLKSKGYLKEEATDDVGEGLSDEVLRQRMQEILDDVENFRSKPAAEKVDILLTEKFKKSARDCLKDVRNKLKMYDDESAEDLLRAYLESADMSE